MAKSKADTEVKPKAKAKLSRKPRTAEEFIQEAEAPLTVSVPEPGPAVEPLPEASPKMEMVPSSVSLPGPLRAPAKKKITRKRRLPWRAVKVRADVMKSFNLRIPEPYLLKLRFIAANTPDSMQAFITKVLFPAIDNKIESLLKKDKQT